MVAAKQEAEEERDMTHSRKQHKAFCLFPGSADNRLVVEWISKTGVESGMEMKIKNIGVSENCSPVSVVKDTVIFLAC